MDCCICLCEIIEMTDNTLLTSCNHYFHSECINTWLDTNNTCPCCRTIIKEDEPPLCGNSGFLSPEELEEQFYNIQSIATESSTTDR